jgi:hypothetical protein
MQNCLIIYPLPGFLNLMLILICLSCGSSHKPHHEQSNTSGADFISNAEAEKYAQKFDRTCFPLFLESLKAVKNDDDRLLSEFVNSYPFISDKKIYFDPFVENSWEKFPVNSGSELSKSILPVEFPIKWNDTVQKDHTWLLYFQTLNWVLPFLKSENKDSLNTGLIIVNDWISAHTDYPDKDELMAFNDQAVSERMIVIQYAFKRFKQDSMANPQFERRLLLSILGHMFLCGSLEKYNSTTNHGIIMDNKLIKLLSGFESFNKRDDFLQLAFKRVWETYRKSFTTEGVHKEHSPCYHAWITEELNKLIIIADSLHISVPGELRILRDKALDFTNNLQINGLIPAFGDCSCNKTIEPLKIPLPQVPGLNIYPQSGWAFINDTVSKSTVIIQSDFFSKVHYHEDETSFILTVNGQDLIIDPGLFSYTPGTSLNQYMTSAFAHNVLIVDNQLFEPDTAQTGLSGITRFFAGDDGTGSSVGIIELTHPHYNKIGVGIYRQFAFLGNDLFIINDSAYSTSLHDYSQVFHLAPGAIINKAGDEFTISWPDCSYVLKIKSNEEQYEIVEGEKEPNQGWYFPEFKQAVPAPVLILITRTNVLNFKTIIKVVKSSDQQMPLKVDESGYMLLLQKLRGISTSKLKHQPILKRWQQARS